MLPTRVLLIEDDEEDYLLLQKLLKRIASARYELEHVELYDAGLARMLEGQHDLCLLDYRLGARNGIELLKEARARGYSGPIVLLTGADESEIDIQALQAGADDYISKSQLQGELLHRIIRYAIERKKAEQERASLLREQLASKELERKKNEFISMVVHEIKTPLTSLKGFTQLLQRRLSASGESQLLQFAARIDAQSNKLTTLIDDLLDVTRIEGETFQFDEDFFAFDDLIGEVMEEVQIVSKTPELRREGRANSCIWGDRKRIGQVVTNFLTNALKYAYDTEVILVKTRADAETLTFCVQDFGSGIPKEQQARVFEPYYRIEGEKQKNIAGLGLGLFISAEIIRGQHGQIWVESQEGQGSTFCFTLPVVAPPSEE